MAQFDQVTQIVPFTRIVDTFWGTFLGAFVALLFVPITSLISRVVKRSIKHYNSLVVLETQLNEMIGIIKDNNYLIPDFKKAIINGNIYWSLLKKIPVDKKQLSNLGDIGLINDVFEFFYSIRKINDDIDSLNAGYHDLKNAFIEKNITVEHYANNAIYIAPQLNLLERFYDDLMEELIDLLTKIRIQIRKDKPLIVKIQEFFNNSSSKKMTLKEFKDERDRLEDELQESSRRSGKKIKKLLNK